jgi:hypothetical protein
VASILTVSVVAGAFPSERSFGIAFGFMAAAFILATAAALVVPVARHGVGPAELAGNTPAREPAVVGARDAMGVR